MIGALQDISKQKPLSAVKMERILGKLLANRIIEQISNAGAYPSKSGNVLALVTIVVYLALHHERATSMSAIGSSYDPCLTSA